MPPKLFQPHNLKRKMSDPVRAWPGLHDRKSILFVKTIGISLHMGLARPGQHAGQLDAKLYVYATQIASPTLRAQPAGFGQAHMKGNQYCFEKQ